MARAAKAAGVRHAVWSTFEDTRKWIPLSDSRMPTLMEKYKVPHFDAKAEADVYFRESGVPTTYLLTTFYWENFIFFGSGPQRLPDGRLALVFPMDDAKIPGIATADIGRCVYGILKRGSEFAGKYVGVAGEHPTGAEMAASLTRALGQTVVYNPVPPDVYRSFGFPGAYELGNMFQFERDFNAEFCNARDLAVCRSLNPSLMSLDQWLAQNASRIPLPQ
jgi:uncharacterized protein YbjT (DUF2867 family)